MLISNSGHIVFHLDLNYFLNFGNFIWGLAPAPAGTPFNLSASQIRVWPGRRIRIRRPLSLVVGEIDFAARAIPESTKRVNWGGSGEGGSPPRLSFPTKQLGFDTFISVNVDDADVDFGIEVDVDGQGCRHDI